MLNEHQIEELLRRSNPEPDTEALRMEPHVVRVSSVSIVERRETMSTSLSQPKPLRPRPGSNRWSRPIAVATTAALAVLVLVGSVALLSRTDVEEIVPVALPADVTLLEGTWQRTVIESLAPLVHFEDMEATSFGLVAAAVMQGVWISENGAEWHQALTVPYEPSNLPPETVAPPMTVPPPPGLVESYVRLVTEYDGALYAVGIMATGINTPEMESRLVVWRSGDGRQWNEITLASSGAEFAASPVAMVASDDALLIYDEGGAVYRSEDGESFARSGSEETGIVNALSSVARYGDGYVAIGETYDTRDTHVGETAISHVYTSADGITWTQVPGSEFPAGHYPYEPLVEFEGALYVGGLTFLDDAAGAVWRSTDGETFAVVDLGVRAPFGSSDDENAPAMYGVQDLIVTPQGMLVVGHLPGPVGNHADVALLATSDGTHYDSVLDPDGVFTDAVQASGAFFDGSITMVGYEPDPAASQGITYQWVWTP